MTVIEPCPQGIYASENATGLLKHARTCHVCQASVRQLKPACTHPALGLLASLTLGEPEPLPELSSHLDSCLACRLERLGFESLDEYAVTPRSAWRTRLLSSIDQP